jgi:hypothetical protein
MKSGKHKKSYGTLFESVGNLKYISDSHVKQNI